MLYIIVSVDKNVFICALKGENKVFLYLWKMRGRNYFVIVEGEEE